MRKSERASGCALLVVGMFGCGAAAARDFDISQCAEARPGQIGLVLGDMGVNRNPYTAHLLFAVRGPS